MLDRLIHPPYEPAQFGEPRWARFLFASRQAAWLWLIVRLYLAWAWIPAGWGKITSGEWLFGDGAPIAGLLNKAIADPGTPTWYATFLNDWVLPNASVFATLVALGELAVGLGLLVGLLTGFLGVGGGFLIVPALVLFADIDAKVAAGTSLAVIAVNCATGLLGHLRFVQIDWPLVSGFVVFAVAGIVCGTQVSNQVPAPQLRRAFGVTVVLLAIFMGLNNLLFFPHQ